MARAPREGGQADRSAGAGAYSPESRVRLVGRRAQESRNCALTLYQSDVHFLLDEPFSGIDPIAVLDLQKDHFRSAGERLIADSDHRPQCPRDTFVGDRSSLHHLMRVGFFVSGTPEELGSDPEVRRVYLGESFSLV